LKPIKPTLGAEIRAAWIEYKEESTAEARFIREMDKFECLVQAHEYERKTYGEKDLEEFQGLSSKIYSPEGLSWLQSLQQERQAYFAKRQRRIAIIFMIGITLYS
jgi:putative hydrolases of HD superfamily